MNKDLLVNIMQQIQAGIPYFSILLTNAWNLKLQKFLFSHSKLYIIMWTYFDF